MFRYRGVTARIYKCDNKNYLNNYIVKLNCKIAYLRNSFLFSKATKHNWQNYVVSSFCDIPNNLRIIILTLRNTMCHDKYKKIIMRDIKEIFIQEIKKIKLVSAA